VLELQVFGEHVSKQSWLHQWMQVSPSSHSALLMQTATSVTVIDEIGVVVV
jgi:hypothetical protein